MPFRGVRSLIVDQFASDRTLLETDGYGEPSQPFFDAIYCTDAGIFSMLRSEIFTRWISTDCLPPECAM
jgi:hypothetical protein